ncbi:MAG: putative maltokinase, partial [Candidatus Accumulibacter sp.]|nr:putative maltokinase [Accumulibacter sp.]
RSAQPVELNLKPYKGLVPVEMLGQTAFPPIGELPYLLTLPRHEFYWFRLTRTAPPVWHEDALPGLELRMLVLFHGWKSFFVDRVEPGRRAMAAALHERLVREVLPEFLPTQRWFAGKGDRIEKVEFEQYDLWPDRSEWLLARIRVWPVGRPEPQDYGLPLALAWGDDGDEKLRPLWPHALAKIRVGARLGLLYDALADERFCQTLVGLIARGARLPLGRGWLRFSATRAFAELAGDAPESLPAKRLALDSSNTTIAIGDQLLMKAYRRMRPGINPELEMGRFLTEIAFPNIAPLAGALEYENEGGDYTTLVLLQGFVANQGDAWSYTQDYLRRFLTDCVEQPNAVREAGENVHAIYRLFASTLGRRTGELHRALAQATGDPAFDPEPITAADIAEWLDRTREEVRTTLDRLEQGRVGLPEPARVLAERLLVARSTIMGRLENPDWGHPRAMKTRYHGDYHLGQVLVVKDDVIIIDFEGEPSRSLAERRGKHSPLKDVVGMLRSFNYAAHAALRQATADGTRDRATLLPHLSDWEQQTRVAFLEGYVAAVDNSPGYPADPDHARALLELFALEKACYELRYELDNRPDWVEIPLGGLSELLSLETQDAPQ